MDESFLPNIVAAPPPPESDIISKFCVCFLCEYREGDILFEHQQKCEHEWLEITQLRNNAIYIDIFGRKEYMGLMREINEVDPAPQSELEILQHGIAEIATLAPGHHLAPDNPCYGVKREIKDYAARIQEAARNARDSATPTK